EQPVAAELQGLAGPGALDPHDQVGQLPSPAEILDTAHRAQRTHAFRLELARPVVPERHDDDGARRYRIDELREAAGFCLAPERIEARHGEHAAVARIEGDHAVSSPPILQRLMAG